MIDSSDNFEPKIEDLEEFNNCCEECKKTRQKCYSKFNINRIKNM